MVFDKEDRKLCLIIACLLGCCKTIKCVRDVNNSNTTSSYWNIYTDLKAAELLPDTSQVIYVSFVIIKKHWHQCTSLFHVCIVNMTFFFFFFFNFAQNKASMCADLKKKKVTSTEYTHAM